MLWIGITGPMGSGKSTVAHELRALGYDVLDADAVVHEVLAPGGDAELAIKAAFGAEVIGADGHVDRRALGRRVFDDASALATLEGILHPRVRAEVSSRRHALAAAGRGLAFYDVPLLFEKKMEGEFDHVLVVSATRDVRLRRVMARTGLSEAEVEARWRRQLPPEYKEARASAIIRNDGDLDALKAHLHEVLATITNRG